LNLLVTAIGREEEYKHTLISRLESMDVKLSGKESVLQMEKMINDKSRVKNGK